jgi:vancomycin resistance protein YoaR
MSEPDFSMAHSFREPAESYIPDHVRNVDLIRPARQPHVFREREAQRRLHEKERHWAPVAYGVFAAAMLVIFCVAYGTYAFSKYRGVILPGVYVDQLNVSGMTATQADNAVQLQLASIHLVPVILTYGTFTGGGAFRPTAAEIGVSYPRGLTGKAAMAVGRQGSFIDQLIDRLPLNPTHTISAVYVLSERQLRAYMQQTVAPSINSKVVVNAAIKANIGHDGFHIYPLAQYGRRLDVDRSISDVRSVLGSLTKHTVELHAFRVQPAITNGAARHILDQVDQLLSGPPIIAVGKRVLVIPSSALVPMLAFADVLKPHPAIQMTVQRNVVEQYIATLASQIDRPAQNAKMRFSGGKIVVIQRRANGRSLDQASAVQELLSAVQNLQPNARLHFSVTVTQPPVDVSNPASLGIDTLLGEGETSFKGAGPMRLSGVTQIAQSLDQDVIKPGQEISFNTLVGTSWDSRVYDDRERRIGGVLVPGDHGAMQQVATTFLRAMYGSGLTLLERHAHPFDLGWYQPPYGYDAIVAPGRNWDLRFSNTTAKYLLIETRVEPLRQQLYIYVYGASQKARVFVDPFGKVVKTYPHGPEIVQHDTSLPPGTRHQVAWAHDGADTVVQRTITYANGSVHRDEIDTHYQPQQAIVIIGSAKPKVTPTPTPTAQPSGTPTPTASPGPTPTPTFSH